MKRKKILFRVAALMSVLVLAASCMGTVPYYANADSTTSFVNTYYSDILENQEGANVPSYNLDELNNVFFNVCNYSKYSSEYPYYCIFYSYDINKFCMYLFKDIPYVWFTNALYIEYSSSLCLQAQCLYDDLGNLVCDDSYYRTHASPIYAYCDGNSLKRFNMCLIYTNADITVAGDSNYVLFNQGESISSFAYNPSLGYVQDISVKYLTIVGDHTGEQSRYKISYSPSSTSGIDLSSGDYVIRFYEQATIYQISAVSNNMLNLDMPKILIGEYDASTGTFDFNISEALKATDAETGDIPGFNIFTSTLLGYVRSDSFWLQIYNKTTGEYGGFVKLERSPSVDKSAFSSCTYLGSEDDISKHGEKDNLGYIDNKVDGSTGSGTNFDDAELNADKTTSSGSDSVLDQFYDLISLVSAVPKLFAALFGFLPEWCLNIVAISIAVGASLVIWKLAS